MEILMIIGIILLFASFIIFIVSDDDRLGAFAGAFIWLSVALIVVSSIQIGYKQGQINALQNKYSYEMRLVYPLNDTIPCDTLYVKIK